MSLEQQVSDNTTSIQQLIDDSQTIDQLPIISTPLIDDDKFAVRIDASGITESCTPADITDYVNKNISASISASMAWEFSTTITEADPTAGKIRLNHATPASVTKVFISEKTFGGADASIYLNDIKAGDILYIQQNSTSSKFLMVTLDSDMVDNGTWFTATVTISEAGSILENGEKSHLVFFKLHDAGVTVHSGLTLDDGTNPHGTTKADVSLGNVDNTSDVDKPVSTAQQTALDLKQDLSEKGVANGYAELDSSGFVPSAQLPGFVDDVVEYASLSALQTADPQDAGKIYVTLDTNLTYRYSGTPGNYTEISASLALGETSATAYRGDRGKTAYDHSQTAHTTGDMEASTYDPAGIVEQLVGLIASQTLTNKTLQSFTNDIYADHIHEELRNESGVVMNIGDAVYISGYSVGQEKALVTLADASAAGTMPCIAILAQSSLSNNETGDFIEVGMVPNMDTSSWTAGDELYISNVGTSGNTLTSTKPQGTDLIQKIAIVLRSHATLGIIEVFGAGRAHDLPHIQQDYYWVGDSNGVPQQTAIPTAGDVVDDTTPQLGGNLDLNSKGLFQNFVCGETLAVGDYCCMSDGTVGTAGRMYLAANDVEDTIRGMIAICIEAGGAGNTREFLVSGIYVTTGLTAGGIYYVGTAGNITTTPNSTTGEWNKPVGQAQTTTVLYFNPGMYYTENA